MLQKYVIGQILFLMVMFCQLTQAHITQEIDVNKQGLNWDVIISIKENETIIGYLKYQYQQNPYRPAVLNGNWRDNPYAATIDALCVAQDFQRKGYGTLLLARALKGLGMKAIETFVKKDDIDTAKLLEKHRFKLSGYDSATHKGYVRIPTKEEARKEDPFLPSHFPSYR